MSHDCKFSTERDADDIRDCLKLLPACILAFHLTLLCGHEYWQNVKPDWNEMRSVWSNVIKFTSLQSRIAPEGSPLRDWWVVLFLSGGKLFVVSFNKYITAHGLITLYWAARDTNIIRPESVGNQRTNQPTNGWTGFVARDTKENFHHPSFRSTVKATTCLALPHFVKQLSGLPAEKN